MIPITMLGRVANLVKGAFFPDRCLVCSDFFHHELKEEKVFTELLTADEQIVFQHLLSPFLCASCLNEYSPVRPPVCLHCGIMFKSRIGGNRVCGSCLKHPKKVSIACSPGIYEKTFRSLIHKFKYEGKIQLATPLGMLLFSCFIKYWRNNEPDVIIPVPLHIKRFRERGFNQAFLLIRDFCMLSEKAGIINPSWVIEKNVLVKNKKTDAQTGLDRKTRKTNVKNAFTLKQPEKIYKKRILIVDDVYTTGATIEECAGVLLREGAEKVEVLTLARAV